jgi:hypothetical protein
MPAAGKTAQEKLFGFRRAERRDAQTSMAKPDDLNNKAQSREGFQARMATD